MMNSKRVSESVICVGVTDTTLDLFEGQYQIPNGISYNSYIIMDEKIAVMDAVDARMGEQWIKNVQMTLEGRVPNYLIISHMEPDHSSSVAKIAELFPHMTLVGNDKTFRMLAQYNRKGLPNPHLTVKDGDTLSLGTHTLKFIMAPMVHWPEVMVSYEQAEKILFSADAFGTFGAPDDSGDWLDEARRYYINIVGKYGVQVQSLLKKAATLDIRTICPLHGRVLDNNLPYYVEKYNTWSSFAPEKDGVLIAFASIHGNTANAARVMADMLKDEGVEDVHVVDLARYDMSKAVADAFSYSSMIVMSSSYDGGVFQCMADFLNRLEHKNYRRRTIAYIENGTWAPCAARAMKAIVANMKDINEIENTVTILSTLSDDNLDEMRLLAREIASLSKPTE